MALVFLTTSEPQSQHINVNEESRIRYIDDNFSSNFFIRKRQESSNF
jgi:hypothetical protein